MKTIIRHAIIIATCVMYCWLAVNPVQAQETPINIQINDIENVNADPDGIKAITVLEDTVYAVWIDERVNDKTNLYFSKSIDGGEIFSTDVLVYNGPDSIAHAMAAIAVNANGIIYIAWTAISNNEQFWNIWTTRSTDSGNTFETPIKITNANSCAFSNIAVYQNNVYIFYANMIDYPIANYFLVRSTNGGLSYDTPLQVNDATGSSEVYDYETSMIIDESGIIYLAWADGRRANGHGDICFAKSTNSGLSVGDNIIVNDISTSVGDSAQYKPRIAIGSSTQIYIAFVDDRLGSDDWTNKRLYLSISTNGGNSFSPEVLIANHNDVCIKHDIVASEDYVFVAMSTNYLDNGWGIWGFESNDGGENFAEATAIHDTQAINFTNVHLSMPIPKHIYAMWGDDRNELENINIYFANIDHSTKITENSLKHNVFVYPNPSSNNFTIDLNQTCNNVNISIYNTQSQLVYTQHFEQLNNKSFPIDLPSGIYYIHVQSNETNRTIKLIKE